MDIDERAQQWRAQGWRGDVSQGGAKQDVLNVVQEELQVASAAWTAAACASFSVALKSPCVRWCAIAKNAP